ncbi:MAG: hypothetical protein ACTSYB_14785 [Candidatus Helarchaeota archaeon]
MEKKKMALTLLLGALHYCASELVNIDPAYKQKLTGIDIVFQYKTEPDGPNSYAILKDSRIEYKIDAIHENPTFVVTTNDLDLALKIFKGKYLISEAIKQGDVEVIGDKQEILKYTFFLEDLVPYLGDLTG